MSIVRRHSAPVAVIALLAFAGIAVHHAYSIRTGGMSNLEFVAAGSFAWLCFTSLISYCGRSRTTRPGRTAAATDTDDLRVTVIIPAHNEDPAMLRSMLDSLTAQTRPPARIHLVENGNPARGYQPTLEAVFADWAATVRRSDIERAYTFNPIAGKREAQAVAVAADPTADVYMTLDSDVKLAPTALAHGIARFADPTITSVGGFLVGLNRTANLLTRLVEVPFACASINGRIAQSLIGSVGVNSGALAFYRGHVLRGYMHHYLTHTIAGRKMVSGDDAMMTRYALLEGKTAFEVEAWGYTLHPERLSHLSKQRLRWWRSFWWGNDWLLRTFKPTTAIWWLTAYQFVQYACMLVVLPAALIVYPIANSTIPAGTLAWILGISYLGSARYLTLRRPGESFASHFGSWLLSPLATLLNLYLSFVLSLVGLVTCLKTGWSSRETVEVALADTSADEQPSSGADKARGTVLDIADIPTMSFTLPVPSPRRPAAAPSDSLR